MKSGWEHFSTLSEGCREGLWIVQAKGSLRHFFFSPAFGDSCDHFISRPPLPRPLGSPFLSLMTKAAESHSTQVGVVWFGWN